MASLQENILRIVNKIIEPAWRAIQGIVMRAVLDSLDDSSDFQICKVQVLNGETQEVERLETFGFTSHPLPSSEAVLVFVGGNRDHGFLISIGDRATRPKDQGIGSSTQYDASGSQVYLDGVGNAEIKSNIKTKVSSPLVEVGSGAKEAALNGVSFQTTFNTHTHLSFGVPTTVPQVPSPPTDLSTAVEIAKTPV